LVTRVDTACDTDFAMYYSLYNVTVRSSSYTVTTKKSLKMPKWGIPQSGNRAVNRRKKDKRTNNDQQNTTQKSKEQPS